MTGLFFPWRLVAGLCALGVALGILLLAQHWVYLGPALPWLLILACPLLHIFLHRGLGHRHDS